MSDDQVISHKSEMQIKLYDGDMLFQRCGKIIKMSDYSPFTATKSVVRYTAYGPEDAAVRKKIAGELAKEPDVDERIISHLEL